MAVSSGPDITQVATGSEAEDLQPVAVSREKYRPELDGIRALCIIFTIFNHIPNCPRWINGVAGVDIFFPLSGWLITTLLVREYQESGNVNLRSFWIRRIFRIMPLYYVIVAIYILLSLIGARNGAEVQLHSAFMYMVTMNMEFRPIGAGSLFGHAWTLGIEEKFYLVWPLILSAFIRKPLIAALVAGASLTVMIPLTGYRGTFLLGYLGLSMGAGLSLLSFTYRNFKRIISNKEIGYIFLFQMLICYGSHIFLPYPLLPDILLSLSSAFVIASLWFNKSIISQFLCLRPLPWLGRLTYATYLVQSLCIRLVDELFAILHDHANFLLTFVFAYGVSIAFALVLHRFVEVPMIRLGKSLAIRYATNNPARDMPVPTTAGKL